MDLYRLTGKSTDLTALDLDHVFSKCISLIEWPERMGALLPMDRLDIRITIFNQPTESSVNESTEDESDRPRQMVLQPHGTIWQERVDYLLEEGYVDDLIIDRLTSAS
jgi:tRNA A37 threonylcarbamoyladenosine biosynthesis protein TsaE